MLLILEIILTIAAWKRGWKWWTLLIWAMAVMAAFFVSMARNAESGFVADIVLVVGLLVMSIKARKLTGPDTALLHQEEVDKQRENEL